MWRIPGEMVEGTKHMKKYDITDKFKNIITNGNNDILKKIM